MIKDAPPAPTSPEAFRAQARRRPGPTTNLAFWAVVAIAAAGALSARVLSLAAPAGAELVRVEQLVEVGALGLGALVAWWLAVGFTAGALCAIARTTGRQWSAGERFVARHAPAVVRRVLSLSLAAGVGLAAAVLPAGAQPSDPPADLGWSATRVEPVVSLAEPADTVPTTTDTVPATTTAEPGLSSAAGGTASAPAGPAAGRTTGPVTVQDGDSLWAITARHLAPGATAGEIAAEWPRWYAHNRGVVGADPDRLRPGQVLTAPPTPGEPAPGEPAPGAGSGAAS